MRKNHGGADRQPQRSEDGQAPRHGNGDVVDFAAPVWPIYEPDFERKPARHGDEPQASHQAQEWNQKKRRHKSSLVGRSAFQSRAISRAPLGSASSASAPPSPRYSGGEGRGEGGESLPRARPPLTPTPLPPGYRGERGKCR